MIRYRILFTLLFASISAFNLYAQTAADTLKADEDYFQGRSFARQGKYDSALFYYQKSASLYKKAEHWTNYMGSQNKVTQTLRQLGKTETALNNGNKALTIGIEHLGEDNPEVASMYENLGIIYYVFGQYDNVLKYFEKALKIRKEVLGPFHSQVGASYSNIGNVYLIKGFYTEALTYFNNGFDILKTTAPDDKKTISGLYYNIGNVYHSQGSFDQSLSYHQKALEIRRNILTNNHPEIADSYNSIANNYHTKHAHKQALLSHEKALKIRIEYLGEESERVAETYFNIGLVYLDKSALDSALIYFHKSLDIRKKIFVKKHPSIAESYSAIGKVYKDRKVYDSAIFYLDQALNIRLQLLDSKNPLLAQSYNQVGNVFLESNNLNQALKHFQKAITSNIPDFNDSVININPNIDKYLNSDFLLTSLSLKALAFQNLYSLNGNLDDLTRSLETYELCDSLIGQIRNSHLRYGDKVAIGTTTNKVYEGAIQTCLLLNEANPNQRFLEKAFHFSERNKSVVLGKSLTEKYTKKFLNLPDTLTRREGLLQADQAFYHSQINLMESQNNGYDTSIFDHYVKKLFDINRELDSLKLNLEEKYPRYHKLKYENSVVSISQLQQVLPEEQTLLSYFEGEERIYIFSISKNYSQLTFVNNDSLLKNALDSIRNTFDITQVLKRSEKTYRSFTFYSNYIFKQLLASPLLSIPEETSRLIIIPDGKLSYIPWETLIRSIPDEGNKSYSNLDYLFNHYAVSYAHSASLLFNSFYQKRKKATSSILAFAPTYPKNITEYTYSTISSSLREELRPLKWNGKEVGTISKYFNGEYLSGNQATEKVFKEKSKRYKILHLAMHALVDNENPMLSKLVFTQDNDSTEDNMLHTYELFNMDLSAELTVLSACNTGIGKLQKGEGVMSLGRAFSYAGCPSIVMSHWSVDDQSTSELMRYFYKHLADGKDKSVAMQQAKKDFLNNTTEELRTHPLYWAGFVVLGDTSPITGSSNSWLFWLVAMALLSSLAIFILIRRISK